MWSFTCGIFEREKTFTHDSSKYFIIFYFFQKGYLYHVTNTRNVDSILEQGLITLNKKFDQNLFIQVEEVNQCWKAIAKRNKIYKGYNTLIEIPGYKEVMNTRFESVYLSNDLTSALGLYGDESEIYKDFLQKLINTFDLSKDIYLPQEALQQVITSKAHNLYKIEVKEWDCIIQFFNSLYESFEEENRQSIILVPIQNINNQYMYSSQYDNLRKEPYDFSFRYTMCSDIEYRKNISKEGLIAIDILEDTSKKVKLKVRGKDLNL